MARDTSPIVKQSRREGYALHPKAHKIMARKSGIPGQHAHGRAGKPSLYLTQLREKQKVRRAYGLLEKQFVRLMNEASRGQGLAGENLLQLLERRLDNVVYRSGLATSRRAARQRARLRGAAHHRRRRRGLRLRPGQPVPARQQGGQGLPSEAGWRME